MSLALESHKQHATSSSGTGLDPHPIAVATGRLRTSAAFSHRLRTPGVPDQTWPSLRMTLNMRPLLMPMSICNGPCAVRLEGCPAGRSFRVRQAFGKAPGQTGKSRASLLSFIVTTHLQGSAADLATTALPHPASLVSASARLKDSQPGDRPTSRAISSLAGEQRCL